MRRQRGFTLFMAVIILGSIILIMLVGVALSTITFLDGQATELNALRTQSFLESCAEEALISLHRDSAYSGGTAALPTGSCTITVSGVDNTRTIVLTSTSSTFYGEQSMTVTLSPFAVEEWNAQ